MFRRLILTGVTATGLVGGLALTPNAAQAHEFRHEHRERYEHHTVRVVEPCRYEVYCGRDLRGTYCTRTEADRCARDLRCHGFRVDVRCR